MASKHQQFRPDDWKWSCGLCKKDHAIKTCKRFLSARADERYDVAVIQRYCINCLARSHLANNCPNKFGCRVCTKRHNTLLHDAPQLKRTHDSISTTPSTSARHHQQQLQSDNMSSTKSAINQRVQAGNTVSTKTQMTQTTHIEPFIWTNVFIPTATVRVAAKEKTENWSSIRALINQSTTLSRISSVSAKKFGFLVTDKNGMQFAILHMRARNNRTKFYQKFLALITDDLPRRPYASPISENPFEEFSDDTLADLDPRSNTLIELELGSDIYPFIRRDGAINLQMGQVVAQKTALGYTFVGPIHCLPQC